MFPCPVAQRPVLVIDEDAAIGHRWCLLSMETIGQLQSVFALGNNVTPPNPGRHSRHTRQLKDAVGRSASAVTFHHDTSVLGIDTKPVIATLFGYDANGGTFAGQCFHASHLLHIIAKHGDGLLDYWFHLVGNTIRDGLHPIKPYHTCGLSTNGHAQYYCQNADNLPHRMCTFTLLVSCWFCHIRESRGIPLPLLPVIRTIR